MIKEFPFISIADLYHSYKTIRSLNNDYINTKRVILSRLITLYGKEEQLSFYIHKLCTDNDIHETKCYIYLTRTYPQLYEQYKITNLILVKLSVSLKSNNSYLLSPVSRLFQVDLI